MTQFRVASRIPSLLPVLTLPAAAAAQTAPGSSPSSSTWGGIAVFAVILALLILVGAAVKLYDRKRKREEEALLLQSSVTDALLLDRGLAGLAISAVATGSRWRRAPLVIAITGTVPTPELRVAVMHLAQQEVSRRHPRARTEDRLMVNPPAHTQLA